MVKDPRPAGLPISLWWHHPIADRSAIGLANAALTVQRRYDFDLVKLCPAGTYQAKDLGLVDAWCGGRRGFGMIAHRPLQTQADWERLGERLSPGAHVAEAMAAIPLVRTGLPSPRPVLQTVFSPVAVLEQLAGSALLRRMLDKHPELAHAVLGRLSDGVRQTIALARAAGASGIFYAIQHNRAEQFPASVYRDLYTAYDAPGIADCATMPINLIHLHGAGIHFLPQPLPPNCWLHWELYPGNPSLRQMLAHTGAPLAIGLPGGEIVRLAEQGGVASFRDDLLRQLDGRPAMVTPGCTLPLDLPADAIDHWRAVMADGGTPTLPRIGVADVPADGEPAMVGTQPERPLDHIVARAWADVLRPSSAGAPGAALTLHLRLEQDLRRPLPLGLVQVADGPERLASRIAGLSAPEAAIEAALVARSPHRLQVWLLFDPRMRTTDAMGLVRVLGEFADVQRIELDPAVWLAHRAEARRRLVDSVMTQFGADGPDIGLLGYGAVAGAVDYLAAAAAARGRRVRFARTFTVAQARSPTPHRSIAKSALSMAWHGFIALAIWADRPGLAVHIARLVGKRGAWRVARSLESSAAHYAQRVGITRLQPMGRSAEISSAPGRFPGGGAAACLTRESLLDPAYLVEFAASITGGPVDQPGE